ncbi:3'-5' exonuclease [uncultured Tateyamaria sp.]|uniref:3'-5' exonuclease n=1 Tax=uncultured Tateyamaria sp. TaxID=455651 RepID=UPI00344E6E4D
MRLNLRLRIFLFFCLLAIAGLALAAGAMAFGWFRAPDVRPTGPFLTAFVVFGFLNTGLILVVWLLFDEHVAKPINRLSAHLRLRAHAGVDCDVTPDTAQYLGDLAPAVDALAQTVKTAGSGDDTKQLSDDHARLVALLSEIPIATILLNAADEIILYDGQAAALLSAGGTPCLKAPLAEYFDLSGFAEAKSRLSAKTDCVSFALHASAQGAGQNAKLKALEGGGHMICVDVETGAVARTEPRPLVFDFDLINAAGTTEVSTTPLSELCYVVFDTETTGLSVEQDHIIQLGAVRVLNGRRVPGEVMDAYVNPGRPIPLSSTKIHGIADADVADATDIGAVGRAFYDFARDAVLVAHNAPFDIGLLRAAEAQMGVKWNHPVLDTVLLSAAVFGTTQEHSLDALCDRLSITIPVQDRHTALGDAKATAEVLVKLLPLLEARGFVTFGDLIAETRRHSRLLEDLNA